MIQLVSGCCREHRASHSQVCRFVVGLLFVVGLAFTATDHAFAASGREGEGSSSSSATNGYDGEGGMPQYDFRQHQWNRRNYYAGRVMCHRSFTGIDYGECPPGARCVRYPFGNGWVCCADSSCMPEPCEGPDCEECRDCLPVEIRIEQRRGSACAACCEVTRVCNNGLDCCAYGYRCIDNTCQCPPENVCGNTCCREGTTCDQNTLTCECRGTQCGSACCGASERCIDDKFCCPPDQQNGSACCKPGENHLPNGVCCPADKTCGGNTCCPGNKSCVDGTCRCATEAQMCGDKCCHSGHVCQNGECVCRPGELACGNQCCPNGSECLDGAICSQGTPTPTPTATPTLPPGPDPGNTPSVFLRR